MAIAPLQLAVKITKKELSQRRLEALRVLKPVISWQHPSNTTINCGCTWLTVYQDDKTLVRLQGYQELHNFTDILEAALASNDQTVFHFNNGRGDISIFRRTSGSAVLTLNSTRLDLAIAQTDELLAWLALLLQRPGRGLIEADTLAIGWSYRYLDGRPVLSISEGNSKVISAALAPAEAVELKQALLTAASERSLLWRYRLETAKRFINISAGNAVNWPIIAIDSLQEGRRVDCSNVDLLLLAADLHLLTSQADQKSRQTEQ